MVKKRQLLSDQPQFKFRMDAVLRSALQEKADVAQRSLTQELLARLNASLELPDDAVGYVRQLEARVALLESTSTADPQTDTPTDLQAQATQFQELATEIRGTSRAVARLQARVAKLED